MSNIETTLETLLNEYTHVSINEQYKYNVLWNIMIRVQHLSFLKFPKREASKGEFSFKCAANESIFEP